MVGLVVNLTIAVVGLGRWGLALRSWRWRLLARLGTTAAAAALAGFAFAAAR